MDRKDHWENMYAKKRPDEVSWYQSHPEYSLRMIEAAKLSLADPIIDVGGGASRLVDYLVDLDYKNLTVLDISKKALKCAKQRLGDAGKNVRWIEADITEFNPERQYSFWHDRAVFHFLTDSQDRIRYLEAMNKSISRSGYAMIATFALDGPEKCSSLPVQRYSDKSLQQILEPQYRMILSDQETHLTPNGNQQKFIYTLFGKV